MLQNRYGLHYKLCYRTGTFCITNCATEQVQSALQTVLQNRYIPHFKLCYRTGTVCITNCATEQVQSAFQTVLLNRYSPHYKTVLQNGYIPHYKLCYRTGTVRITISVTEQVQATLPEVQHSGHMLTKDVVQLGLRVDVLVAPVQEGLPISSHYLQTEPHTLDHIGTVSERGWGRHKAGLEFQNGN